MGDRVNIKYLKSWSQVITVSLSLISSDYFGAMQNHFILLTNNSINLTYLAQLECVCERKREREREREQVSRHKSH